jgi:hypothetical protein
MGQDPQTPVVSCGGPHNSPLGGFGEGDIPGGTTGYDTREEA